MTTPMHPTRTPDPISRYPQNNPIPSMTPATSMLSATTTATAATADLHTASVLTAQANQVIERTRQLWQL